MHIPNESRPEIASGEANKHDADLVGVRCRENEYFKFFANWSKHYNFIVRINFPETFIFPTVLTTFVTSKTNAMLTMLARIRGDSDQCSCSSDVMLPMTSISDPSAKINPPQRNSALDQIVEKMDGHNCQPKHCSFIVCFWPARNPHFPDNFDRF